MSKEEIDLLKVQLLLDYYKNKDITQHYRTLIENNIVFNNDTLDVLNDINETIYITKFDKHIKLQQENKQLKDLIDTILNFSFFKEECPLNFSFEDNSKEDKAQDVFYENEYCENACNDDYRKCWLKYFKKLQELEQGSDSK